MRKYFNSAVSGALGRLKDRLEIEVLIANFSVFLLFLDRDCII